MTAADASNAIHVDRASGRIHPAALHLSPNHNSRPPGIAIDLIVIHCISLPRGVFGLSHIDDLFMNRLDPGAHPSFVDLEALRVSCHALIHRDGALVQYVPVHLRAWHAGPSQYRGRGPCNDFSVGIELEGEDSIPYTDAQYARLIALIKALIAAYPSLSREHITGHADIAPERKTDPGPAFDWKRLHHGLDHR